MELSRDGAYQLEGRLKLGRGLMTAYVVEVTTEHGAVLEFGRFSIGLIGHISLATKRAKGLLFRCGALCETSDALIVIGGEHDNSSLWNLALGGPNQLFSQAADHQGVLPARPTLLGDNVLLSEKVVITTGLTLGDGVVIGAGAVVTRDCEPFGIYAGVPARRLRDRFGPERQEIYRRLRLGEVEAHQLPQLGRLVKAIEAGELSVNDYLAQVSFLKRRAVLHFTARHPGKWVELDTFVGASIDGEKVDEADFNRIAGYLHQDAAQPFVWSPDVFAALGLY